MKQYIIELPEELARRCVGEAPDGTLVLRLTNMPKWYRPALKEIPPAAPAEEVAVVVDDEPAQAPKRRGRPAKKRETSE